MSRMLNRREFIVASSALTAAAIAGWAADAPIKLAHREGNMLRESTPKVYEMAASIPGISGLEVQTVRSNLWDREMALTYKKESLKWKIRTVSMGGSFPAGGTLLKPHEAEDSIRKSLVSGEILGAGVVLVGGFRETCPRMDDEASYGPVVEMLKRVAPMAADIGMIIGLELSLTTDEYLKLLKLVDHPAVRAYWDAHGTESMVHQGDGIRGIEVIGKDICQMHLKNGRKQMWEEDIIDWPKTFAAIKKSGYDNWFAFETAHASPEACIEQTKRNIAYVMQYLG